MVNLRLRRAGLPIAVSAVVVAVAVTGTILTNGSASADTTKANPSVALAEAATAAKKFSVKESSSTARALAATDESDFGDLTGDGKADLAAIDSSGTMWVYPGKRYVYPGTGTRSTSFFSARIKVGTGWGKFTSLVRHGDFNGDGKQDILTRDSSGKLFFYAGTGNPLGMFKKGTQAGTGWGNFTSITGAGDLTGDGRDDLLGQKTNGELALYTGTNNPAAPFGAKGKIIGTGWKGSLLTAMGDLTGDGRTEFQFRNSSGVVYMYESRAGSNPIGTRTTVIPDGDVGNYLKNMVGMGDLASDAQWVPTPDTLWQGKDGALILFAADWEGDVEIGSGWANYRLF
ncbi:FG-GAP repeat domain-containing protein [Actinoplanes sp. NPDC004185]